MSRTVRARPEISSLRGTPAFEDGARQVGAAVDVPEGILAEESGNELAEAEG